MIVLGIDPGQSGALAIVALNNGATPEFIALLDVPMIGSGARERVDVLQLRGWITDHRPQHCLIERSQAMPKQGASSGFKYGRTCGSIEAAVVLSGVPWSLMEPTAWKKFHRLGRDKELARQRAMQLLPAAHSFLSRKRDHNRAEALLIALAGGRS